MNTTTVRYIDHSYSLNNKLARPSFRKWTIYDILTVAAGYEVVGITYPGLAKKDLTSTNTGIML